MADRPRILDGDAVPGLVLGDLVRWACEESRAFGDEDSPFSAAYAAGHPAITIVVGPNASGKSLLHRLVASLCHDHGILPVSVSIRERTGNDVPLRRAFMFGDETDTSTGANSVRVVKSAFEQVRGRPTGILLDEPEMGLSEGYAHAYGRLIAREATKSREGMCGTLVTTHSRSLVRGIVEELGSLPGIAALERLPADVAAWLETPECRTIEELDALQTVALDRFRQVHRLLKI